MPRGNRCELGDAHKRRVIIAQRFFATISPVGFPFFLESISCHPFSLSNAPFEGVYGERLGDTAYLECLWDVYALVSDTGIQYYVLHSYNRAIGAVVTFMGLMFAATLTGAR